jgi:hypothetical protein
MIIILSTLGVLTLLCLTAFFSGTASDQAKREPMQVKRIPEMNPAANGLNDSFRPFALAAHGFMPPFELGVVCSHIL